MTLVVAVARRGSARALALLGLSLMVGCASMGVSQSRNYRMVPPADFAATVTAAAPVDGLAAPPAQQKFSEWAANWIEGPVSTVATREESETYGSLDSDVERAEFIRLFWERRNPEPEANYNESLLEFDRRLAVADALFSTETRPGWRSVFGRALLTLGFPTVVRVGDEDGPRATTTAETEARSGDKVFWQYGLRPEDLAGTSLDMVHLMSLETLDLVSAQSKAHLLSFTYWRGGWGLSCSRGWLVGALDDSWSAPGGGFSWGGSAGGVMGATPGVAETSSPDVEGSGGVAGGWGGGGGGGAPRLGRRTFGAGCSDVFRDARSGWLLNTVRYP